MKLRAFLTSSNSIRRNWIVCCFGDSPISKWSCVYDSSIRVYWCFPVLHYAKPRRACRRIPYCRLFFSLFHEIFRSFLGFCHGLEVCYLQPTPTDLVLTRFSSYAFQWLFALPLEVIAGALTIQYWNDDLPKAIFVTIFLLSIAVINLFGIKGYGEAEFIFSTMKITAIVGFM